MSNKIVLVVEDDVLVAAMASLLFQSAGFVALTSFRADEAMDLCRYLPVALAVVDVDLSGQNGLDLARGIRGINRSTKIVIHSGSLDGVEEDLADAFVPKATSIRQLLDTCRNLVEGDYEVLSGKSMNNTAA